MSHFTVLVVGDDLEDQLDPFYSQTENKKYLKFEKKTEEYQQEYETKSMSVLVLQDGSWTYTWDQKFKIKSNDTFARDEYSYPEGSKIEDKPFNELFSSFDIFIKEYHSAEIDEEMQTYGYWNNPNGKWDWYTVGGRWTGFFKLKAGAIGELGDPGAFDNKPRPGYVDSCKLKDIDIEGMKDDAEKDANATYDKLETVLNGRDLPSWNEVKNKYNDDIKSARHEYNNLDTLKDLRKAGFFVMGEYKDVFKTSRQEYVQSCIDNVFSTFAVLKGGKWYEKGDMGWFVCVANEKEQEDWRQEIKSLLDDVDEDTLLTIVDCHN